MDQAMRGLDRLDMTNHHLSGQQDRGRRMSHHLSPQSQSQSVCGRRIQPLRGRCPPIVVCHDLKGRLILGIAQLQVAQPLVDWSQGVGPWTSALETFAHWLRHHLYPACGINLDHLLDDAANGLIFFAWSLARDLLEIWAVNLADPQFESVNEQRLGPNARFGVSIAQFDSWFRDPGKAYRAIRDQLKYYRKKHHAIDSSRPPQDTDTDTACRIPLQRKHEHALADRQDIARDDGIEKAWATYHVEPTDEEVEQIKTFIKAKVQPPESDSPNEAAGTLTLDMPMWLEVHTAQAMHNTWDGLFHQSENAIVAPQRDLERLESRCSHGRPGMEEEEGQVQESRDDTQLHSQAEFRYLLALWRHHYIANNARTARGLANEALARSTA